MKTSALACAFMIVVFGRVASASPCREVELAIDTDTEFFWESGGSHEEVEAEIVAILTVVDQIYRAQTRVTIQPVVIHTYEPASGCSQGDQSNECDPDPYGSSSSGEEIFATMNAMWPMPGAPAYDLVHFFGAGLDDLTVGGHCGKAEIGLLPEWYQNPFFLSIIEAFYPELAGLANPNTVCNPERQFGYSLCGGLELTAHELGHNLGSFHDENVTSPALSDCVNSSYLMCGSSQNAPALEFSASTKAMLNSYINSVSYGCLSWTDLDVECGPPAVVVSPVTNVKASDGTDGYKINVDWTVNASSGVTPNGFEVLRAPQGSNNFVRVALSSDTYFDDNVIPHPDQFVGPPVPGQTYCYKVIAHYHGLTSSESNTDCGFASQFSPPINLTATQGTEVQPHLFWQVAGGPVLNYLVYRSTTPGSACQSYLTTLEPWTLSNWIDDFNPVPGQHYYYSMRSRSVTGELSACTGAVLGYGALPPLAVTNLLASDGTFPNKVRITWSNPTGGAPVTGYALYRSATPSACSGQPIAYLEQVGATFMDDNTVPPSEPRYYSIRTVGPGGISTQCSNVNSGYRLGPPTNVLASAGLAGGVTIQWTPPYGASAVQSYRLYRSSSTLGCSGPSLVSNIPSTHTSYIDTTAVPGVLYYYSMKSMSSQDTLTICSNVASGYAATSLTANTSGISFSGTFIGSESETESYVLQGSGLTGSVTVVAPPQFWVSLDDQVYVHGFAIQPIAGTINQTIYVRFKPTSLGIQSGTIVHYTQGASLDLLVAGIGLSIPTIQATPANLAFGNVPVGVPSSKTYHVTAQNLVSSLLIIAPAPFYFMVGGVPKSWMSLTPSNWDLGTIDADVTVYVSPGTPGVYSGTLMHQATGVAWPMAVSATAQGWISVAAPASITFPPTPALMTPPFQSFQFTAQSVPGPITVSVPVGGPYQLWLGGSNFGWTQTIPGGPDASSGATISLKFTPPAPGNYPSAVTLTSGSISAQVPVSGTGTGAVPSLTVSLSSLAFAPTIVGGFSPSQSFNITGSNLIQSVSVGPSAGLVFSTTADGTYSTSLNLSPSSGSLNQTVHVRFVPTQVGPYASSIAISTLGSAATVSVSGHGVPSSPGIYIYPSLLNFPATPINTPSASQDYILYASGLSASSQFLVLGDNQGQFQVKEGTSEWTSVLSFNASVIGVVSKTISVRFVPTVVGPTSDVSIFHFAPTGMSSLPVSGVGTP